MATVLRLAAFTLVAYTALGLLLVMARTRIIFPAPREETPEPRRYGMPDGDKVVIETGDGETLVGWYLPPMTKSQTHRGTDPQQSGAPPPRRTGALLWLHGNGETVASLAAILREFRPARAALLVVDYRGYGESSGRATVEGTVQDALAAYRWLAARPDLDPARIVVYGRSVGTGPAVALAATEPVAGLILESAFTSLRALARVHYPVFPSFLAGRGFDNLAAIGRVPCPLLFIHGDADHTIPAWMGRALTERAGSRAELWAIPGADHNETYLVGGREYVRRVNTFIGKVMGDE